MRDPAVSLPESLQGGEGPLVSVIVPTYGDSEYLDPALESIVAQTHENIEIIVVDSSDVSWLRELATRVDGFTYLFQEPSGLAAARNRGLDAATGELIAFLDADDRWLPEKLDRQLAAVADGADVVYSDVYLVENGEKRRQSALPVHDPDSHHIDFLYEGGVPMPTVLARRDCFVDERFDERLPVAEDRHLWARLFARYRPARVAEPLACYTRREGSMSSDLELMYETELTVIADLADRLPVLTAHRAALERKARYKYGKRLLRAGRSSEARHELRQAVVTGERDPRALALLAVAYAPAGHARLLELLERLQEIRR
ncbi:glycosyltransferase family 2 protein [Halococcus thailandensis]|uniref:Glycosyl transferase family protein n=1 Tax=Halococcus thailandensis JCM 13552 TaxID=1227457 RepID=M0MYR0_9EURY|nr:glycosyltransferase [Halococcus thailandensis]EMA49525.1 glycosyl transferase family protein [Halococcus thailandensis JCM 13552]